MPRNIWAFTQLGQKSTSDFGTNPADVQPARYPQLMGIDGRYVGEIRRYPGNIPLDNSFGGSFLSVDQVEPFEVSCGGEFGSICRGFVVKGTDASGASTRILWNVLGATNSYTHSQQLLNVKDGLIGTYTDGGSTWDYLGTLTMSGVTSPSIVSSVLHDDGNTNGSVPYAVINGLTHLGSRQVGDSLGGYGVIRLVDGKWFPVGRPGFNGEIKRIRVVDGNLYVVGAFTKFCDQQCIGVAKWTGTTWIQIGTNLVGGIPPYRGTVWDIIESPDTPGLLYICGALEFNDSGWVAKAVLTLTPYTYGLTVDHVGTGGTTYDPTGTGYCMAVRGGYLYMAGSNLACNSIVPDCGLLICPTSAGGFNNVASTGWSGGASTAIYNLAVIGTKIYNPANSKVRSWDGYDWVDISFTGSSDVTAIRDIQADGSDLLVGGTGASGHHVYLFKYSSSTWTKIEDTAVPAQSTIYSILPVTGGVMLFGDFLRTAGTIGLWDEDTTISVSTRGKYLYILASNGDHFTLEYNGTTFDLARFGPQYVYLAPPAYIAEVSGNGKLTRGNYLIRYRYRNVARGIYTALSGPSADVAITADGNALNSSYSTSGTGGPLASTDNLNRVQILQTISSLDTDYAAGGSLYLAADASFYPGTGDFDCVLGADTEYDSDNGTFASGMDDASLVTDALRLYDAWNEDVTEMGHAYASYYFQGVHFAVERVGGAVLIRWSSTTRDEPENFPAINEYWTEIRIGDLNTCRLIRVGEFLVLFGGDRVYRIQKSGGVIGIVELCSEYKVVSSKAFAVVGQRVFIVSELGLLMVDVTTGGYQLVTGLDRIFLQRWRGKMTSAMSGAYDARMSCLFFHEPTTHETLCVWSGTGIQSLLICNPALGVASSPDVEGSGIKRAYFWNYDGTFRLPNYKGTGIQSMTGFTASPITSPGSKGTLNPEIVTLVSQTGTSTVIDVWGDWPLSTDTPDKVTGLFVVFKDGTIGQVASTATSSSGTTRFTITTEKAPTMVAGDRISLDPVILCLVGASLWAPTNYAPQMIRGIPDHMYRKKLDGGTVQLTDLTSQTAIGVDAPVTGVGVLSLGATRQPTEIRTALGAFVTPEGYGNTTKALVENRASMNDVSFRADGEILFPVLFSTYSNLGLSILSWTVRGDFSETLISGPRASS